MTLPVPFTWATDPSAAKTEPLPGLKASGYVFRNVPTAENLNWILNAIGQNMEALETAGLPVMVTIGTANTARAAIASGRRGSAGAIVDGVLYVLGGLTGSDDQAGKLTDCLAYNIATNAWTSKAAMPVAVAHHAADAVGTHIHYCGGRVGAGSTATTDHYYYDTVANTYTSRAALGAATEYHSFVNCGGNLYRTSGLIGSTTHEQYNPTTNAWTAKAAATGRHAHGACVLGGDLYANGGGTLSHAKYRVVENDWTDRAQGSGITVGGLTYTAMAGLGFRVGGDGTNTLTESYNPTTNAWTARANATGHSYHVAATDGTMLFVVTGWDTGTTLTTALKSYLYQGPTYTAARYGILSTYRGGSTTVTNKTSGLTAATVPVKPGDIVAATADTWGVTTPVETIFA